MQLKRNKHLHSKEHLLADDLSRAMLEEKKFAAYLGIAKLYHESDLRRLMRYVLEKTDLLREARGKYFFASLKGLEKRSSVKFKREANLRNKQKRQNKKNKKRNGKHLGYSKRTG